MRELFEWILTTTQTKYLGEMGIRGDGAIDCNVKVLYFLPARNFPFDRFCIGDFLSRMVVIAMTAALKYDNRSK
jgi:hypothetical protein